MDLKRPNLLALYRAGEAVNPAPQTEAFILAAARASQAPARRRRDGLIAAGLAAVVAAVFLIRITTTANPGATPAEHNDFGSSEGQDRTYLMTFDTQTRTGPGSREGLP